MKSQSFLHDPTELEIQHAAYYLWQEKGRPLDRDFDIWLAAKDGLKHRPATPTISPSPRNAPSRARNAQALGKRRR